MLCLMYFKPNIIKKYVHFVIQLCSYNDLLKFTCVLQCTSQDGMSWTSSFKFQESCKMKGIGFFCFTKQTGTFHFVRFLKLWSSSCWGGRNPFLGLPGFSSPSLRLLLLAWRFLDPGRPSKQGPSIIHNNQFVFDPSTICLQKKCGFNKVPALRPLNIWEDM